MSQTDSTDHEYQRTREEKLKALIRKDIDPRTTELAKRALKYVQEGSS